jgi:hypothetical protein
MLSAGMPELKKKEEIQRLVTKLDINASEQEADKKFKEEIDRAQKTFSRRMDNLFHNWNQVPIMKNLKEDMSKMFNKK